ncbi:hypothetical protein L3Q67_45175 (plasmid) [Saccharothrix sp. AJ9571]|nr:hypothetical protein L3Q67_45175 [Saccharothrix sp. AJ9571]
MERRKIGRPSKGARKQKLVRLPVPLVEAAEQQADEYGMPFNDLVARLLSEHLRARGVEVQYDDSMQEELPLTAA